MNPADDPLQDETLNVPAPVGDDDPRWLTLEQISAIVGQSPHVAEGALCRAGWMLPREKGRPKTERALLTAAGDQITRVSASGAILWPADQVLPHYPKW